MSPSTYIFYTSHNTAEVSSYIYTLTLTTSLGHDVTMTSQGSVQLPVTNFTVWSENSTVATNASAEFYLSEHNGTNITYTWIWGDG